MKSRANGRNEKNGIDGSTPSHDSHSSHISHPSHPSDRLLPPRGDYHTLLSFQKAEIVYDITFRFAHKFLSKGDRTIDQLTLDRPPLHRRLLVKIHGFPFLSALTAIALGCYLVYLTPVMLRKSYQHLINAQEHFREDYFTALARQRGRKYVDGILKIQDAIPPNKPYLLVGGTDIDAIDYFVRYDLAPRPCHYLGVLREIRNTEPLKQFGELSQYVVISNPDPEGPVLMTVQDLEKLIAGGAPR